MKGLRGIPYQIPPEIFSKNSSSAQTLISHQFLMASNSRSKSLWLFLCFSVPSSLFLSASLCLFLSPSVLCFITSTSLANKMKLSSLRWQTLVQFYNHDMVIGTVKMHSQHHRDPSCSPFRAVRIPSQAPLRLPATTDLSSISVSLPDH